MGGKVKIKLGPVQETLLIPLFGRAQETKKPNGLLCDIKALEMVESLDYDFNRWQGTHSLVGASIRTLMFDEEVQAFLTRHPCGTVIEIGVGLNTRFERLDNGRSRWIEIDLADSMALRRQFFADNERRSMFEGNVLNTDWYDYVKASPPPYCFVAEASIIYLDNSDVEQCLCSLAQTFPSALLITDTTSSAMVHGQHKHDVMKDMPKDAWFHWCCDQPSGLMHWGLRLEKSRTLLHVSKAFKAKLPLRYRLMFRFLPWLIRRKINEYRINRFCLQQPNRSAVYY